MILDRFKVPQADVVRVPEAALRQTAQAIFERMGVTPDEAAEATDVLVMTDLRAVETHGVSNMLRAYVRDYRDGKLNPAPGWRLERETPGTAVIDGERRLGLITGPRAMRLAMDKAAAVGVGVVNVHNSGHFGAIGHHALLAAERNMVGVCFTGAGLSVVPTFASRPLIGTNPIAIAAPARNEAPILFDVATSAIAGNKIRLAMRVGAELLPGWVPTRKAVRSARGGGARPQRIPATALGRHAGTGVAQGLWLRADGGGAGDAAVGRPAEHARPRRRLQEPLRGVQHRSLHRPRTLLSTPWTRCSKRCAPRNPPRATSASSTPACRNTRRPWNGAPTASRCTGK